METKLYSFHDHIYTNSWFFVASDSKEEAAKNIAKNIQMKYSEISSASLNFIEKMHNFIERRRELVGHLFDSKKKQEYINELLKWESFTELWELVQYESSEYNVNEIVSIGA